MATRHTQPHQLLPVYTGQLPNELPGTGTLLSGARTYRPAPKFSRAVRSRMAWATAIREGVR